VPHPTAGTVRVLRSPFTFSETQVVAPVAPPLLGQHTDEVLRDLGYDDTRIAALRETKVIR
jgi:crotonobetainyl-CoA:carnitine CoA-transferase CaiB-like acyl-CoA transferase